MRRVMRMALDYRGLLAIFLLLVVVDAVLTTINPLILRDIINNGIGGHDTQLIIELAVLAAVIATLDMAAVDGPLQPGTRLGGFLVLHAIGSGGMGVVYAAQQERPRRTVAIKELLVSSGELSTSQTCP